MGKNDLTLKSLQSFLSPERLLKLAGQKVYERGAAYHATSRVRLRHHFTTQAMGIVLGTQPYRVELTLQNNELEAGCTCPAMLDFGFCKHAVALGLLIVDGPPPTPGNAPTDQPDHFAQAYPNLAAWVQDGWIEIGRNGYDTSLIRIMDEGGTVWDGGTRHKTIDDILREADAAIADFF